MTAITSELTVGELVAKRPALSRLFEARGVDYCCGGKKTLAEVCREKGWTTTALIEEIEKSANSTDDHSFVNVTAMSLTELCDHIEQTHHAFLRRELPRMFALANKVASVHGSQDPRLAQVRDVLGGFIEELSHHMMKEEQVLFPIIRQIDSESGPHAFHCGSIANPIRQMELEHRDAGNALQQHRELTDDYTPPDWACNTYRALLDALAELERDMHQHVHKEESVLFPAALQREQEAR
ncbi:MAG: iron-sulfur cluster repair di-iron protein [Pirellulales bacterium]|nr:iron-sulfur cluster repair di-iron protein [Pirellulales bacterium]